VRFENWYAAQINQLGRVAFADGTVWSADVVAGKAAAAPWLLRGSELDDFIFGGPENEALQGGEGNDTYFIGRGGGVDTIADSGGVDTLRLDASPEEVSLGLGSLRIRIGDGGDEVHLESFDPDDVLAGSDIEIFRFADGTELGYAELVARGFDLFGTPGDDTVVGTNVLDRIDGGAGDDLLAGGLGSDTYRFGPASGQDLIREAASATDSDTLEVLAGPDDVTVTREDGNIVLSLAGGADRVAVEWFGDPDARIENVTFADGTAWDAATLEAEIPGEANQPPVVAHPLEQHVVDAGAAFVLAVPAETFADEDAGDELTLSASLFGGGALPSWLAFDPASATFSGKPKAKHIDIWQLSVTATDAAGASASSDFGLIVRSSADATAKGDSGDDVLYGNSGDETLKGKGGNDYLFGDAGDDVLKGGRGDDILVGGLGNDTLRTGRGADVIVFNRGDGRDTIIADRDGDDTLSFGGGIRYSDLSLARKGKDLIVDAGGGDRVTLKDWYSGKRSVVNLQVIEDAGAGVQTFDFLGLARSFEQARRECPGVTSWALTHALLQWHLSHSDDEALDGDLAYWYGKNRGLGGISVQAAQQALGAQGFGADAHSLRPFEGLKEGLAKLG
jgi:Ca2+-binding RTX toxin-like protein